MLRHAKPEKYKQNNHSSKMLGTSLTLAIGSLVTGQRFPPVSKNACAASKRQNPPTRLPEESKKTASDGQCTKLSVLTYLWQMSPFAPHCTANRFGKPGCYWTQMQGLKAQWALCIALCHMRPRHVYAKKLSSAAFMFVLQHVRDAITEVNSINISLFR